MAKIRATVTIHGRVQGVGYRFSTIDRANSYGLDGWVRNTWERTVEAVFEGEEQTVREMVKWCHHGPMMARVKSIDVTWSDATGEFQGFHATG
jgi:acylphosphatase